LRVTGRTGPRRASDRFSARVRALGAGSPELVAQADRAQGRREKPTSAAGLRAGEREDLVRLRRANKQLRLERDILSRAAAWFARAAGVVPPGSSNS